MMMRQPLPILAPMVEEEDILRVESKRRMATRMTRALTTTWLPSGLRSQNKGNRFSKRDGNENGTGYTDTGRSFATYLFNVNCITTITSINVLKKDWAEPIS